MKSMKFSGLLFTVILLLNLNNLLAQEVNYTEVNVYGWGLAINEGVPLFYDIDQDGYMDLLVGNSVGTLWHYEQSSGDEFVLISHKFSDIDVQSQSVPTLTDLDHDGLLDLVVGNNGAIKHFEQDSAASYRFNKVEGKMYNIDIGARWAPTIADIDNDGLLDMIVGESLPNLNHFVQDSIGAGTFSLVSENWLGWSGVNYQTPVFMDYDDDGLLDLMVGNMNGKIAHLVQDSVNSGSFTEVTDMLAELDIGEAATPQILDIDEDGKRDLYVGEWYIGLHHYEETSPGSETYLKMKDEVLGVRDFGAMIGYTIDDIDNDGLIDMLVSAYHDYYESYIMHYEQEAVGSLQFTLLNDKFSDISIKNYEHLCLYDINGNGLKDLLIGDRFGYLRRYEQDAVNFYDFSLQEEKFNNEMKVNQTPQVAFSDLDGDSLLDMIVGEGHGLLHHYEQDEVNSLTFTKVADRFTGLDFGYYSSPVFTDIDGDSLQDLIVGNLDGRLYYYEQDSTNAVSFTQISKSFGSVFVDNQATPRFADVNNDGKVDLFVGDHGGGITLHIRNDDLDITAPDVPQNLTAQLDGDFINLNWTPCSAEDVMLYNIYRGVRNDTVAAEYLSSINADFNQFTDSTLVTKGTYYYWLSALDLVGNESALSLSDSAVVLELTSLDENTGKFAKSFTLQQNFPNPFNPQTTIQYYLAKPAQIELQIYNINGQKIKSLMNNLQPAGVHSIHWNGTNDLNQPVSSGTYIYRMSVDSRIIQSKKMLLLR